MKERQIHRCRPVVAVSPDGSKVFVRGAAAVPGNGSDYVTVAYAA